MFGLGIRYLMGWAMAAADGARKQRPEWPPHPDRVFMALAAAWFETDQDEAEGKTLRWLEGLKPPRIAASQAIYREVVNSFVQVNDDSAPIVWDSVGRNRQPRSFPLAIPHNPIVHLIWMEDLPEIYATPLASLCRKVVSVGHSASLVQMWLSDVPPTANLIPVNGSAKHRLRITGRGRLDYLEARCNRQAVVTWAEMDARVRQAKGKEKKMIQFQLETAFPVGKPVSLRPESGLWQGYGEPLQEPSEARPGSLFDSRLIVLTLIGGKLSLSATLKLTEALRGALLKACPLPIPEWVSGHTPSGTRGDKPHLAIFPLAFVGSEHADGRIMGVALAIPRDIDPYESSRILTPWLRDKHGEPRRIRLFDGRWLECAVELDCRESPPWNLRPHTWTGAARTWCTVTPIVLDRHFDGKDKWERAADALKDGCERIGLPRPVQTLLHPVSMFEGVPRSNQFPWLSRKKDGGRMQHSHAVIMFDQKVEGPVVVGAGRFRGYGLCRPLERGEKGHV